MPESERLVLREWREKDWPFFAAMNANPQVMRFFPGVMTDKDSLSMWNRSGIETFRFLDRPSRLSLG